MTKNTIAFLAARLREPSTLAGLSLLATLAGLPPGTVDASLAAVAAVAGLAAAVLPDPKLEAVK
jgi:hypothetical protein